MQLWTQFYAAIGSASAALLGLLFVAVSINASAAFGPDEAVSRRLTEQAFSELSRGNDGGVPGTVSRHRPP
jgi:hypothetical protein